MEKLIAFANTQPTSTLYETVRLIGGASNVSKEKMMARAACIQVIEMRDGEEAGDALMDELGM
jgi:hypothetical protein